MQRGRLTVAAKVSARSPTSCAAHSSHGKVRPRAIGNWLWLAAAVSLVVSLTPWAQIILYPFKLFTTWVHECGHALMTVIVGGHVTSITMIPIRAV